MPFRLMLFVGCLFWGSCGSQLQADESPRPNVLFIAIDDLNDWAGPFKGHPQAKTPNLDRFAAEGSVVFQNAHCPGPVCGPSRSAMLSGVMPDRSGVYSNSQNMLRSKFVQTHATLPEAFAKAGYQTISRGKIFHAHATPSGLDRGQWAFTQWVGDDGGKGSGVNRQLVTSRSKNLIDGKPVQDDLKLKNGGSEFAWGPTRGEIEGTKDYRTARWAAEQLRSPAEKPFFLAVGLSKPHLPFYVPQEFFDMHPVDQIELPPILENDLDDILKPDGTPMFSPSDDFVWLKHHGQMKQAVRAYLAASSYADACLGVIFDAIKSSPHADNTIVFVFGDHGWHLGEKLRYRKATLWGEATRCPLIIRTPTMTKRLDCDGMVNLIDLYPTLVQWCDLPRREYLDGVSLCPLLADPSESVRDHTVTMSGPNQATVTDGAWRYIQHGNGVEELYDLQNDPQEWTNLIASESDSARVAVARLRLDLSKTRLPAKPIEKSPAEWKQQADKLDRTLIGGRDLSTLQ